MKTKKIDPIHPGEILMEEFLNPFALSQNQLANDIAKRIQEEMEYPGQIKVNVIRERRSIAYAK